MKIYERYLNSSDAAQQLNHCLVVLDGSPYYLSHVDEWKYSVLRVLGSLEENNIRWSTRTSILDIKRMELNQTLPSLGYVMFLNRPVYLKRKPLRKWKQGLYAEYLTHKYQVDKHGTIKISYKDILSSGAFLNMFYDVYPTFKQAYASLVFLQEGPKAFHKNWAIYRNFDKVSRSYIIEIEYKGETVGSITEGTIRLKREYRYLSEELTEVIVK